MSEDQADGRKTDGGHTTLLVDFPDEAGMTRVSKPDREALSERAVERALETLETLSTRLEERVAKLPRELETIELSFGIKLSMESGALIAKTGGETHLSVKLVWERGSDGGS